MEQYTDKLISLINQCGEQTCNIDEVCKECTVTEKTEAEDYIRIYHLPVEGVEPGICQKICQDLTLETVTKYCEDIPYSSCDKVEAVRYDPVKSEFVVRIREIA